MTGLRGALPIVPRTRHGRFAAALGPSSDPVVWVAGSGGLTAGAGLLALNVVICLYTRPTGWVALGWFGWLMQVLLPTAMAWMACWPALWRITADRDGLWIRRFGQPQYLPWSAVLYVEQTPSGLLMVLTRDDGITVAWSTPTALTAALRRPNRGQDTADLLSIMTRCPELRPTRSATQAERGLPLACWLPAPLAVLFLATVLYPFPPHREPAVVPPAMRGPVEINLRDLCRSRCR